MFLGVTYWQRDSAWCNSVVLFIVRLRLFTSISIFIHSFILFSSRLGAHAHKKIKQYKLVKKKRKKIKRINTMYSATS